MKTILLFIASCLMFTSQLNAQSASSNNDFNMEVGTFCSSAPYGITVLIDRGAAFVVTPEMDINDSFWSKNDEALLPYPICAPDGSYVSAEMNSGGKKFKLTFGRLNDHEVGALLTSENSMEVTLRWRQPFSGCRNSYWANDKELNGYGYAGNTGKITTLNARSNPAFVKVEAKYQPEVTAVCKIEPSKPTVMIISIGSNRTASFDDVKTILDDAGKKYASSGVSSEGDWGNFAGAIAKSLNGSRVFSSIDRRVAHTIGRGWWIAHQNPINGNDDFAPYFAWDSFFNANLASLEDPETAMETVRAVLASQHPDGMISSFTHWLCGNEFATPERTNPPVGSLCVWKLYQRRADTNFLKEVYPALVRWHDWFHQGRARKGDILLSWGSASGNINDARLECGWDDTQSFGDAKMEGNLVNIYNVDLNSLWAMDAENLAKIADAIGETNDAARFRSEHTQIIKAMNEKLWNDKLGLYCNRSIHDNADGTPHFINHVSPMNFYPLICGAPDKKRAKRMLAYLHNPKKFWGQYLLPTLPYDAQTKEWGYWRGKVWGPVNYLMWQGLTRYDDNKHLSEYATRSVELFMKNWSTPDEICGENYQSGDGTLGDASHYTWGALLPLVGMESLYDIDANLKPVSRNIGLKKNITLRNIPIGGVLYNIECHDGKTIIKQVDDLKRKLPKE